ncbi:hypothetical protein [Neobacillus sp. D3-1R]|uniref:hypothetical protein n=1 Tax=Neobacillus sp. D3-1R TaxID=3445778 RepID=UPI003FA117B1
MKKILSIFSVFLVLFIISACSEKDSKETDNGEKQVAEEATAVMEETNAEEDSSSTEQEDYELEDKEEYNQIFGIFLDKDMENTFRKLVGDDLDIFRVTFQQISPVPTEDENLYAFHGYMPGLEGIAEGVVVFDNSGNMWAATTEGENVNFYSTNENEKHHPIIEDWRQSFFSGSEIVYK